MPVQDPSVSVFFWLFRFPWLLQKMSHRRWNHSNTWSKCPKPSFCARMSREVPCSRSPVGRTLNQSFVKICLPRRRIYQQKVLECLSPWKRQVPSSCYHEWNCWKENGTLKDSYKYCLQWLCVNLLSPINN